MSDPVDDLMMLSTRGSDAEWFRATGHCGHCGNAGDECVCTREDPCRCGHLHKMGSRYEPPLERIERGAWSCPGQGELL